MELKNPHDALFKETLSDRKIARSFFESYLPADLLSHIDLEGLEICKESFVEEELREVRCDLLYRTAIDGKPGYVYFLFEHKSYADPDVALQLLGYMSRIWGLHRKQQGGGALPVIVPLVLYHGRDAWNAGEELIGRFDNPPPCTLRYIPNFHFLLIDLSRFSDEEIRGEVMLRATMMLFKYAFRPDYQQKLHEIFSLLQELMGQETGLKCLETVIRYVFATLEGAEVDTLKQIVDESLSVEKGEFVMTTIAEALFNKGLQQGLQQGVQQGIRQGIQQGIQQGKIQTIRENVIDLLTIRFGAPSRNVIRTIEGVKDLSMLQALKSKALIAPSMRAFTADMKKMLR